MRKRHNSISGIYFIFVDRGDGKIEKFYIGEAVNILYRWKDHMRELVKNVHGNVKLQRAFNKYGKNALTFIIYRDQIDNENLRKRYERYLIYKLNAIKEGYNISEGLNGSCERSMVPYHFINVETREEVTGVGIVRFARERGLCHGTLGLVNKGKCKICQGWYSPKYNTLKLNQLISPNGILHEFWEIRKFAKSQNISHDGIEQLLKENLLSYKGWTKPDSGRKHKPIHRGKKKFHLVHESGEIVEGGSLGVFAFERKLCYNNLYCVISGKRNHHKGWRLYVGKI